MAGRPAFSGVNGRCALALVSLLCAAGCTSGSDAAASRCGASTVSSGAWVGVEYGGVVGGGFYDPIDEYDPAVDGTGNYADGASSGDDSGGDVSGDEPPPPPDDGTSSDGSGDGWDSPDAVTRLHLASEAASPAADANGCYTCTVGCMTSADAEGRQAIGISETDHASACQAAVRSLADWSHVARHQRLERCQNVSEHDRTPATPTVASSP